MSSQDHADTRGHISPASVAPSRAHLLAAFVMFLMCLMFAGFAPAYLFWVPLLPVLFAVWVLRERTTVDDDGIGARYLLRRSASVTWADFRSIRFARNGRGYAVRADGTRFRLPGVSFNSLVTLSEATHGRIPDPVTPGRAEAEGKVQLVNKDGYAVLMDKDEYEEYESRRRLGQAARDELARRAAAGTDRADDPAGTAGADGPERRADDHGPGTDGDAPR